MGCALGNIRTATKSPDLTPPDFSLWGHLKSFVYYTRPRANEPLNENPSCYYRHDLSGFRTCALQCASYHPVPATGGTSLITFASPVLVAVRSHIWDTRCSIWKNTSISERYFPLHLSNFQTVFNNTRTTFFIMLKLLTFHRHQECNCHKN
jgi:hypothetical protein